MEVLIMPTKEETLKALYPEDILSIGKDLTEGEVKLLKQLNDMLEEKYRDSVNEHWLNATEPEEGVKARVHRVKCFNFSCHIQSLDLMYL